MRSVWKASSHQKINNNNKTTLSALNEIKAPLIKIL